MSDSPSTTSTPAADPADLRASILGKLSRLAVLRASLKEILAPFETEIATIQKAVQDTTLNDRLEIERLEAEIKRLAAEDPDAVFGENSRTLRVNNLSLGARCSDKVEFDGAEDDIISALEKLSRSSDQKQAMAASACLRKTVELNRAFIRDQFEVSDEWREWLQALGIRVKESTSVSLTEVKPPKSKVTHSKDKKPSTEEAPQS